MDKTFNFFKNKPKKQPQKPRNHSKSNSSKASCSRHSQKPKPIQRAPLSKKQKDIRQAIQARFNKSKLRAYRFIRGNQHMLKQRQRSRSDSSEMEEYRHLRKTFVVNLKEYHEKRQSAVMSTHSSQQKNKFGLKFKLRVGGNSGIMKTEGNQPNQPTKKPLNSTKAIKLTPSTVSKKTQQWKFISIQLKEDLSKPKNRKTEMKINSHRSYNVQEKMKTNSSVSKYVDRGKSRQGQRLGKSREGERVVKSRF